MKKKVFFLVAAIVFVTLLYTKFHSASETKTPQIQSVKTKEVSSTLFQETASFSGFIRGAKQTDIAPKIGGYIIKLTKEEGDLVRQGEILATLDGNEISATEKSALVSLQSFETTIKETKKYYDQKVKEAESTLNNASGSSDIASAEEAYKSAKRLRDTELSSLETQEAGLSGSVLISQSNASNAVIRAPFSGVITRKNTMLGAFVSPGMPIYSIASTDALEITVSLPRTTALQVTKNSIVSVSNDTTTTKGYVFSLASTGEESSQQSIARIHFPIESKMEALQLGEYVNVSFNIGEPKTAIFIPEQSIISLYDDTFVYVVENDQVKKQAVVLGTSSENNREILSGLSDGMHVVIEGEHTLSNNQSVKEIYVQ
ncbi:MAG: efflux RND transporter periplasmic adaptor subunit [Candidatus Moraniibacteriota bacterium]